ncbi:hypothetical protein [Motiliproteus sp. SC1-56]|uniref:hypothetical protein n=1 Tax=Motiliproteus sp. SC1-56 TaxID=2799565 RepID=UPI001A8FD7AE|nr:hypothetical protein [Motiliproteus sp. SC1-56]
MKFQIRLCSVFVVILLSVSASAGLKGVAFDSGPAYAPTEVIEGSISTAGGGVILRSIASCDSTGSDRCKIESANLLPGKNSSTIQIVFGKRGFFFGEKCSGSYTADTWLIKGAIDLVASESEQVFRNINLLGKPTTKDIKLLYKNRVSPRSVWFIEVSPALAKTKAGETLLTLDLLLTDLQQYARDPANASLIERQLSSEGVVNWTWTDEHAQPSFRVNCAKSAISLSGSPSFTFLDDQKRVVNFSRGNILKMIHETNPELLNRSTKFSNIASFLRHIRDEYPKHWSKLRFASHQLKGSHGDTPRLLMR